MDGDGKMVIRADVRSLELGREMQMLDGQEDIVVGRGDLAEFREVVKGLEGDGYAKVRD